MPVLPVRIGFIIITQPSDLPVCKSHFEGLSTSNMFAATRLQAITYFLGVCVFSIAFLVFLNSSISFVITTLIKQTKHVGDAVGTLGFADEVMAIVACPFWGVLSDQIGVRTVSCLGYAITGIALILFVHTENVYPQLLLARLFFSFGSAATSTMITAILPSMTALHGDRNRKSAQAAGLIASDGHETAVHTLELTITQDRIQRYSAVKQSPTRLAGIVGLFSGCGALLALAVFLRLPDLLERTGTVAEQALASSYHIVGCLSLSVSVLCYAGLQGLHGEAGKGWRRLIYGSAGENVFQSHTTTIAKGFQHPLLRLG